MPSKLASSPMGSSVVIVLWRSFSLSCVVTRFGIGARAVELVDEGEARHVVPAHLAVDGVRLRLDARRAAEHEHGAVEDAQRALDLDREVDVAGRVDEVDVVAVPLAVGRGGLDRDALLALEVHRVHLGADAGLAADLLDLVDLARVEEDALGERRLPGVDVSGDADVADFVDGGHEREGPFELLCVLAVLREGAAV